MAFTCPGLSTARGMHLRAESTISGEIQAEGTTGNRADGKFTIWGRNAIFQGVGSSEFVAISQRGQRLCRRGQRRLKEQNEVIQTTPASPPETSTTVSYSLVVTAADCPKIFRKTCDPGERLEPTPGKLHFVPQS